MRSYLEIKPVIFSFNEVMSLFNCTQEGIFAKGSNCFSRFQSSVTEFELFLSGIDSSEVQVHKDYVTFADLLFFCTGCDRIPPHEWEKRSTWNLMKLRYLKLLSVDSV